ncbi:putative Serine/threonine-protein kinase RAD53 [Glarea lozoyensis 74030]|nr:putative Serine/threonine-protein kinase RAD53 [Glarea lozoyensis 74030]
MTPPEENYDFVVWLPKRSDAQQDAYEQKLADFLDYRDQIRARRTAAKVGQHGDTPDIFAGPRTDTPKASGKSLLPKRIKEWQGGNKYNRVGTIGKGAFAVVYKVTTKSEGIPYAAKELEKRRFMKNGILDQKMETEMRIMSRITHPNIVQYIEHVDWHDYLYIIMEFVPGGDLGSLISQSGHLPENTVRDITDQLLGALGYLHGKNITHRDVKPDNILISQRDPYVVKLTDFGLSKMIDNDETFLRTFCGTLLYCAPEVYMEYKDYDTSGRRVPRGTNKKSVPLQRYGHAVDVWSLAGVIWYSMSGLPPYPLGKNQETTYSQLLDRVMTQALDIRPLQNVGISETGLRFVRSMLHIRPEHRATIAELQQNPWITGMDDVEVQVTQETEIEESSSQFSQLHLQESNLAVEDSIEIDPDSMSDVTEIQQREIPSSFNTNDELQNENELLNEDESYSFLQYAGGAQNAVPGGRLFGEVNVSAVGSSGAIPMNHLNLPMSTDASQHFDAFSQSQQFTDGEASSQVENNFQALLANMDAPLPETMVAPSPELPVEPFTPQNPENDQNSRAKRSSSLMGTESLVGNLNMHSPASAPSPLAEAAPNNFAHAATVSLRRPREVDSDECDYAWAPKGMPAKRRRRSEREIELEVPASIFWNPADKSTHHNDYPPMTTEDYRRISEHAAANGETFRSGQKTFETAMHSFRSSRSRSSSIEPPRAHSEPTADEGRRMLMKRDERRLEIDTASQGPFAAHRILQDESLPITATTSNAATPAGPVKPEETFQVVGNDFAPPMRILAKLLSTPDSCLPTINLNITECLTSWGRGHMATVRYAFGKEIRIPKYAFKVIAFKPNFYGRGNKKMQVGSDNDQDMSFYISTKASAGIWINGEHLPSYNPTTPDSASRFWGELRHGDVITVWRDKHPAAKPTMFRFECYWGKSKEQRKEAENFKLVSDLMFLSDIEFACHKQEKLILEEQQARAEEERKMMGQIKQEEKATNGTSQQQNLRNIQQSFSIPNGHA